MDLMAEESKHARAWLRSWLGYVWTIGTRLIMLGGVLALYGKVDTRFETIVVSLLILIYVRIHNFFMDYYHLTGTTASILGEEFDYLRALLKDEPDEARTKDKQETQKLMDGARMCMLLNTSIMQIIAFIAMWHVFWDVLYDK